LCADLLRRIDFLLPIEPGDERDGIFLGGAGRVDRAHQRRQLRAIGLVAEVERPRVESGVAHDAIERVRHEHRVAFLRQRASHFAHHRAQAERVGPDNHAGMLAGRRVDERGVARAVGRLDLDVFLDDRQVGR